jgi:selenocysteine lyase/cysteine desulfurase
MSGYQSIGSFHSENPEDLLRIPAKDYQPPPLPFDVSSSSCSNKVKDAFMLDKSWTFLNHGAFGASLKCGYHRAQQWRSFLEEQPLRYFDRLLLPHLVHSTRCLADFLQTSPTNLALLPNVTSGMNTVIQGYCREHKDKAKVVLWETSYGSVKKMAQTFCNHVDQVNFLSEFCQNNENAEKIICWALEQHLENGGDWNNALLIVDHTASNTAINFPIAKLSAIAKKHGMITVVDGAHGLLAQPVDEILSKVDIYLSNAHKWASCPRGIAFLHCSCPQLRDTLLRIPAIVSHGIDDGFFNRFVWDGTRDYAAALSLPVVLDYWQCQNPEIVREQMKDMLREGVQLLSELWHNSNENCTLVPMHMHSPMALVRLPLFLNSDLPRTSNDGKRVQDWLYHHRIEVPIKCIQGVLYVRLSCHVYNTIEDYEHLGKVLLECKL